MNETNGLFLNSMLSMLLKKIIVPYDFHTRVEYIKTMLEDDVSGLVDSLTDFSVQSASVDFSIETDNEKFTKILNKWLRNINGSYKGQIPRGIGALAEEYFKERWKSSSFPILKISKWETIDGIKVPTNMFFVDGGCVYSEDIDKNKKNKDLISYKYYLGINRKDLLDKGVIITKPYGRWFDEYPTPYLIKRGIYHNWKIIQSLKNKETEILEQILPYMMLIKKGSEGLAVNNIKTYTQNDLTAVIEQFQKLMDEVKSSNLGEGKIKSPIRAVNFDEEIKHLIPDLRTIFDLGLFASAERNILSGLGFIDVIEAVSTSRRESILNPKAFIEETKKGVKDFKRILYELIVQIIEENKEAHKKYINDNTYFYISSSPVKSFLTNDFKNQLRLLWERGQLSNQSYCELVGEVKYKTEIHRREKEARDGLDSTMYPHLSDNREGVSIDIPSEKTEKKKDTDKNGNPISPDKLDDKKQFDIGKTDLVTSPYTTIKQLPTRVKNNMGISLQKTFREVFNDAFERYQNETRAFRIAWSVIREIATKGKDGKWHRKQKKIKGKLVKVILNKAILERIIKKEGNKND